MPVGPVIPPLEAGALGADDPAADEAGPVGCALVSSYEMRLPMYSGCRSIWPLSMAGTTTARSPRPMPARSTL